MNDQQQDIHNVSTNIYVGNEFCAIFEFGIKCYTRLKNYRFKYKRPYSYIIISLIVGHFGLKAQFADHIVAPACSKIIFVALSSDIEPLCDPSRQYLHLTLTCSHNFRYLIVFWTLIFMYIRFFGAFAVDTHNRQISRTQFLVPRVKSRSWTEISSVNLLKDNVSSYINDVFDVI